MAYNAALAQQVRRLLRTEEGLTEKAFLGGHLSASCDLPGRRRSYSWCLTSS